MLVKIGSAVPRGVHDTKGAELGGHINTRKASRHNRLDRLIRVLASALNDGDIVCNISHLRVLAQTHCSHKLELQVGPSD